MILQLLEIHIIINPFLDFITGPILWIIVLLNKTIAKKDNAWMNVQKEFGKFICRL